MVESITVNLSLLHQSDPIVRKNAYVEFIVCLSVAITERFRDSAAVFTTVLVTY